jgi:predicted nucleotidyltransferase
VAHEVDIERTRDAVMEQSPFFSPVGIERAEFAQRERLERETGSCQSNPARELFRTDRGASEKPETQAERNPCHRHSGGGMIYRMGEETRDILFAAVRDAAVAVYRQRLISLAIFGSWARGAATPASDLDLLVVAEPLPPSRMKRVREFEPVADATRAARSRVWPGGGAEVELAPVFKTRAELAAGSPLYLDMTLWLVVLVDRDRTLESFLAGLRERMLALGSRRLPFKGGGFWDYKPDFRPGDLVEL